MMLLTEKPFATFKEVDLAKKIVDYSNRRQNEVYTTSSPGRRREKLNFMKDSVISSTRDSCPTAQTKTRRKLFNKHQANVEKYLNENIDKDD